MLKRPFLTDANEWRWPTAIIRVAPILAAWAWVILTGIWGLAVGCLTLSVSVFRSTSIRGVARRALANVRTLQDGVSYSRALLAPTGRNARDPEPRGQLEEYFEAHTDGPGLWKWRHYFPVYERHFAPFVGRDVHVMEVGIYSGGSLPMWLDYFGENAHVYGPDIEPACRVYASNRVDVFIGDQTDPAFWRHVLNEVPRIDVLIDDGGHEPVHQITTLKETLPAISPGGVYLCEDSLGAGHLFHSFVDALGRDLHTIGGEPNTLRQHVSSIHRYPMVTVIEKSLLPVAPFEAPQHGTQWEPFSPLSH